MYFAVPEYFSTYSGTWLYPMPLHRSYMDRLNTYKNLNSPRVKNKFLHNASLGRSCKSLQKLIKLENVGALENGGRNFHNEHLSTVTIWMPHPKFWPFKIQTLFSNGWNVSGCQMVWNLKGKGIQNLYLKFRIWLVCQSLVNLKPGSPRIQA